MRVKRGTVALRKHKKLFRANKGYRMTNNRLVRVAKEAYLHAGEYAFAGRKNRKRDFRALWILRIGEAVRQQGLRYSEFIAKMKQAHITIDRKMLALLVTEQPQAFTAIVDACKAAK